MNTISRARGVPRADPAACRGAEAPFVLEHLEERQLLTAYVAQSLSDYLGVPVPWASISGTNESRTFVYNNTGGPGGEGAAIVNGQLLPYSQIAGLQAYDGIGGVNDSGLIVVGRGSGQRYIIEDGARVALTDAVTAVEAPVGVVPDYTRLTVVEVNNSGAVLFQELPTSSQQENRAWLFHDGVMTFLFAGIASDVNARGDVVGRAATGNPDLQRGFLRRADGSLIEFKDGEFIPARVTDAGVLFGGGMANNMTMLLRWENDALTVLTSNPVWDPASPTIGGPYQVLGANNAGRLLVKYTFTSIPAKLTLSSWSVFDERDGLLRLAEVTYGYPPLGPGQAITANSMLESADLLTGTDQILVAIPEEQQRLVLNGSGVGITWSADGAAAVAVNTFGEAILLYRAEDRWGVRRVPGLSAYLSRNSGAYSPPDEVLIFSNPPTGPVLALVFTGGKIFKIARDSTVSEFASGFTGRAAAFESADHRQHLAAVGTDGDLVLYFKTRTGIWARSNLTTDHIEASGKTFVPVAGSLTAFSTRWGGMNIAYLDAGGHVQTVWWAPGLKRWTIDDLSVNAGAAAPLHGTLVSYTTPWGGLNIAGTDPDGDLVALWWAPGMKTWRTDRLVEGTPAQLDDDTITAYVTPWGGLNIAGLDKATGKLTAYWWTPGKPAWIVEKFEIKDAPPDLVLKGRISSAVSHDGRMFLAAVTDQNHVANIWIGPETGFKWAYEDVTEAV